MKQLRLKLPKVKKWGGARPGAGRPRKDGLTRTGSPHERREVLKARFPVLATWRMHPEVLNLRSGKGWKCLAPAIYGSRREGFRVVHFAILHNHIHLLVEASDEKWLARGMQGLGVRMAVRLNRIMSRRGRVVYDRYHARILRCPTAVAEARYYVLNNAFKHYGRPGPDPYASTHPVALPQTWLLRMNC
jgi:REP element-mobilizing transposase RayT